MYIVSVFEWLSLAHFAQIATCFSAGQSRVAVRAARAEHVLQSSSGRNAPVAARSQEFRTFLKWIGASQKIFRQSLNAPGRPSSVPKVCDCSLKTPEFSEVFCASQRGLITFWERLYVFLLF